MTDQRLEKALEFANYRSTLANQKEKLKDSDKEKIKYSHFILEDNDNFIVINKPSGIAVQSGTKSFKNMIDILTSIQN